MTNQLSIHFAGDSGDGMQLLGEQFTFNAINQGWQVRTLPDFPAEIRAPQGTKAGVSGFMASLSEKDKFTVADEVDVLVALNPAALAQSIACLKPNGLLLLNEDSFKARDLKKARLESNPLEDGSLDAYQVFNLEMTARTIEALSDSDLSHSEVKKTKNFFVLGLVIWLFELKLESALSFLENTFKHKKSFLEANKRALKAGFDFALTLELPHAVTTKPDLNDKKTQKSINGVKAISLAFATFAYKAKLNLLLAGYPITPASAIMHEVAAMKLTALKLFQAEDEIAAICAAIGASYTGALGVSCTSGPGLDLKTEALGLAVMTELPLVLVNVQRAGPATGLPTKTEQSDLLATIYGRHGESPLPVIAASTPADCFNAFIEACNIAIKYMTPVIVLMDAFLANAKEQWSAPSIDEINVVSVEYNQFSHPFQRNELLARSWTIPGSKDKQHTLGGLEKKDESGRVSYDPADHQRFVSLREEKIANVTLDKAYEHDKTEASQTLVVSWGSTYGAVKRALLELREEGCNCHGLHLRLMFPLPSDALSLIKQYDKVIVCELNQGQLCHQLRALTLKDAKLIGQTNGQPFRVSELKRRIKELA